MPGPLSIYAGLLASIKGAWTGKYVSLVVVFVGNNQCPAIDVLITYRAVPKITIF